MFRNRSIVPVIMFHSVGLESYPWIWSHISESVELFEQKIKALYEHGFNPISWSELYDYMDGKAKLKADSILLTFDDGYLDNWVYVYPILKKYNFKGTIFVNPDFVDPSTEVRKNLDDVWNNQCSIRDLVVPGFLNWNEMRAMEKSGVMDIQSHSMTHTWYFMGPKIIDYHRYTSQPVKYPWLFWNARPDRKPYYLIEDQQMYVPQGMPVLEHEKSLLVTRFYPDAEAIDVISRYIVSNDVDRFHHNPNWKAQVGDLMLEKYGRRDVPGRYETRDERMKRIYDELSCSKKIIEENLEKRVDYVCWPGGGNDHSVQQNAIQAGYKSWTLGSQDISNYRNRYGSNPQYIKRIGSSNAIYFRRRNVGTGGSYYMLLNIWAHQQSMLSRGALKLYKLSKWLL